MPMLLGHIMSVQLALGQESLGALRYFTFKRLFRLLQKKLGVASYYVFKKNDKKALHLRGFSCE